MIIRPAVFIQVSEQSVFSHFQELDRDQGLNEIGHVHAISCSLHIEAHMLAPIVEFVELASASSLEGSPMRGYIEDCIGEH